MNTNKHYIDVKAGAALRRFRTLAAKSQAELGEVIGVTFQQIQKYENGKNRISIGALGVMLTFLGVSHKEFFDEVMQTHTEEPQTGVSAQRLASEVLSLTTSQQKRLSAFLRSMKCD
jgi:transcriptional regulator with XRE-family HTH domain